MTAVARGCEQRIAGNLAATEQRFRDVWHRLAHDERRVYGQLDLLGIEGDLSLRVGLYGGDWLEIELDSEAARSGVRWCTYHLADGPDHAVRVVSPSRCPALWHAAEHYLGRAMYILEAQRRRAV